MICAMEVAMLVYGIVVLITGKMQMSKGKAVVGLPARLIAVIGLIPLPLNLAIGLVIGVVWGIQNAKANNINNINDINSLTWIIAPIEIGVTVVCFVLMLVLGAIMAAPIEAPRKKKRRRDYDDDDDEPRSARSRRQSRDDDDATDDEPVARKPKIRSRDDEDEAVSEKPLPKKRPRVDGEDAGVSEKPMPKRRPRPDDDADDSDLRKPKRK